MSWFIDEVVKGEKPTLLQASLANQLIKALNMLGNISIEKSASDGVIYEEDYGIKIQYNAGAYLEYNGIVKMLDAEDLTKQWEFSFEEGMISAINYVDSAYAWKTIEICEGGSTASYEFLVKS